MGVCFFQPGGGKGATQMEEKVLAGGQKIHQWGQVVIVGETSYL